MWTSPYDPLPPRPSGLLQAFAERAESAPDEPAVVHADGAVAHTRSMLADRVLRTAGQLQERGIGRGDVVALWAPNSPEWAAIALGALTAEAAVAPISVWVSDAEFAAVVARTRPALVAVAPTLTERARGGARGLPVQPMTGVGSGSGPSVRREVPTDPGGTALLLSSSGTTGTPKSVVLTHRNVAAAAAQLGRGLALSDADVVLAAAPFSNVLGFMVTLAAPLAAGATVVTVPQVDLSALLAAVETHRVTVLPVPPPVLAALATAPQVAGHDLSSVQFIASGGAAVPPALQERVAARFPGAVVAQGYGMTETTAVIPVPDRRRGTPPGTVGRLAADTQLRVVDPATGAELGAGQDGEFWVRGPQVSPGYLGDAAATAELLTPDGWLRTGDLGQVDHDGDLVVRDRLKELVKVDGLQVAPAELEELLRSHPAVADAAVVGVPDRRHGEAPEAAVVIRQPVVEDDLRSWVAGRVSPHKRLAAVRAVGQIPRTPAGKVLRRLLRDEALGWAPPATEVAAGRTTG
jgi:acyl-CoA synthetase (AMP-forming)/AMP-acid ligase II